MDPRTSAPAGAHVIAKPLIHRPWPTRSRRRAGWAKLVDATVSVAAGVGATTCVVIFADIGSAATQHPQAHLALCGFPVAGFRAQ